MPTLGKRDNLLSANYVPGTLLPSEDSEMNQALLLPRNSLEAKGR